MASEASKEMWGLGFRPFGFRELEVSLGDSPLWGKSPTNQVLGTE